MTGVIILGNNSAIPAHGRNPTAQVLQLAEENYLIDCGEGTQMQLTDYKVRRSKINRIFISHLHGDHYFGLIGLLTSMGLMGRTNPLYLYGPAPLIDIINIQLKVASTVLPYQLVFTPLEGEGALLLDDKKMTIHSFAVQHRIDCWGFLFRQKKKPRKIDVDRARSYEIPAYFYERLQMGEDYIMQKGTIIPNDQVTVAATPGKSYAYCADTMYYEAIVPIVKGVDLLYHETTYLKDLPERAAERCHSTTEQAATIATLAGVKKLLIGHFSSKYEDLEAFLTEAQEVFPNTELAFQGACYLL